MMRLQPTKSRLAFTWLILVLLSVLFFGLARTWAQAYTWARSYGGTREEVAWTIQQTSDGGYIVAGRTASFGAGGTDVWVLKLDGNGAIQWQKTYGGQADDSAISIWQTSDGGYVVAGGTESFGAGDWDLQVLELDEDGN
jgi:hypothetical protein